MPRLSGHLTLNPPNKSCKQFVDRNKWRNMQEILLDGLDHSTSGLKVCPGFCTLLCIPFFKGKGACSLHIQWLPTLNKRLLVALQGFCEARKSSQLFHLLFLKNGQMKTSHLFVFERFSGNLRVSKIRRRFYKCFPSSFKLFRVVFWLLFKFLLMLEYGQMGNIKVSFRLTFIEG